MMTIGLMIGSFFVGFACGGMLLAYQARRPEGYRANNGSRWRLMQIP